MKHLDSTHTTSLFLIELILAILFFTLASAVCLRIFVKAHEFSQNAQDLNFAVNTVSSAAEQLPKNPETIVPTYSYYDAAYALCDKSDAVYVLSTTLQLDDSLLTADISMMTADTSREIYALTVTRHIQRRVSHDARN